jgi:hypothetical protein
MSHVAAVTGTIIAVEKALNVFGYVPLVSNISGSLRVVLGKIQLVASAVLALIALFVGQPVLAISLLICCVNGLPNIFRGFVENIPVIGNIACLCYDILGGRISYLGEKGVLALI